jgi:hypothetical protein
VKIIYCVFEGTPGSAVFVYDAENLLDIIIKQWEWKWIFQSMVGKVALQLHQVGRSPGAEHGILAAPVPEILYDLRKISGVLKIRGAQRYDFPDLVVERGIYLWPDDLVKAVQNLMGFVGTDSSDLNDFKGKTVVFPGLSIGALVPFQV